MKVLRFEVEADWAPGVFEWMFPRGQLVALTPPGVMLTVVATKPQAPGHWTLWGKPGASSAPTA